MNPTSYRPELDLLRKQVADLTHELAERDRALHERTRHLQVAQALAHLGSWAWDFGSGAVLWSDELYRIFGYEPQSREVTFDTFVSAVLPDDHDQLLASIDDALAGTAPHDLECRIVRPDGEIRTIHCCGEVVRDSDGRPLCMSGTALDVTDRKRTESALRQREAHFRALIEHSSDIITVLDSDGTIRFESPSFERSLGYAQHELDGRIAFEFVHPEDLPVVTEKFQLLLQRPGTPEAADFRFRHKNDSWRTLAGIGRAIRDAEGRCSVIVNLRDITDRKQMEEAVRESEERYRTLVELSPSGVFVFCEGRTAYINHTGSALMGAKDAQEILDRPTLDFIHPDYHQEVRENVKRMLSGGASVHSAERIYLKLDGTPIPVQVEASRIMWNGKPAILGLFSDITERKEAQGTVAALNASLERQVCDRTEALRVSEERFRTMVQAVPSFLFETDAAGWNVWTSEGWCRFTGQTPEQVAGHGWVEALHPDDRATNIDRWMQCMQDAVPFEAQQRLRRSDGTYVWVIARALPVRDSQGKVIRWAGSVTNVDDIVRAQEALLESQARFQQFAESVGSAFLIMDMSPCDMDVLYVNAAFTFIWGIEREEICRNGSLWLESIHPEDRGRVEAHHDRFLAGGASALFYCEYRIVGRDGYIRWIADRRVKMVGWENRIAGIAEDITTHKQQLALMKQTESVGKIGGWELDIVTNRLRWSEETYRLHDTTPELYSPMVETALKFYTPESRPLMAEALEKGITQGLSWDLELELITAMGRQIAVRTAGMVDIVNGRAVRAYGTFQDITERKRAEEALRRAHDELERKVIERTAELQASEERYARATAIGKVVVWEWDINNNQYYYGDAHLKSLFGYVPDELFREPDAWLNLVYPDDQPIALNHWEQMRDGTANMCHFELRMIKKDGSIIWTDVRCHAVQDGNGRLTRLIGATVDITERKEVEQALRASEELFSKAFRSSPDPMVLVELDSGRWLDVNDACLAGLGYQREDVVGRKGDQIEHWLTPDDQIRFSERLRREGSIRNFEAVFQTACGERRDYLMSAERIEYHGKSCMITLSKDITKRRQAEQALWKSQQAIRALHDISSAQGQSFTERVEALLQLGCRIFDLPIGMETVVRGEALEVKRVNAPDTVFHQGMRMPLDKTYCAETLRRKGPLSFEHAGASAEWQRHPAYAALKVESYIGTPINGLERTYGTLCFAGLEPRAKGFTESEKDFVQLMARWLGGELDRQTTLDDLRRSEERYRTLYDETPSMYFTVDEAGIIRSVNQYGAQYLGYRGEDLVGKLVTELFFEEDRPRIRAEMDALFRHPGGVAQWEFRKVRGDGAVLWVREVVRVLRSRDGELLALIVCDDITESKRMERALRRTQFSVDKAVEAVLWVDPTGRIFNVNETACRMLGYSQQDLTMMTVHDIDPNFPVERWSKHWSHLKERGALAFEAKYWSRTGGVLEMEVTFNYLQYDGKEYGCMILRDIRERKRAEAELRRSHTFLRQVIDTDPGLIFAKDREGRFAMANKTVADWYGTTVDDLVGKSDADFNSNADEVEFFRENDLEVMNSGRDLFIPEEKFTDAEGHTRWLQTVKRPIFDDNGQVHMVLGAATDITERKRMEEMLLQRERDLSAALQERERISQDLHDGILQSLYAVGLGLEGCKPMIRRQPEHISEKFTATLDLAIGQLNHVMGEVRNFIAGLESHVIQGGDFPTALRTMVHMMSGASPAKCMIRIDDAAARRLSTEQALHIINIVREGLSNALRHSRATRIAVSLRELVRTIRLTIRDDGIGFNTRSAQGVGYGLGNMAARAQKVRGSFALQSKPWKGTKILLDLPKDGHHARN